MPQYQEQHLTSSRCSISIVGWINNICIITRTTNFGSFLTLNLGCPVFQLWAFVVGMVSTHQYPVLSSCLGPKKTSHPNNFAVRCGHVSRSGHRKWGEVTASTSRLKHSWENVFSPQALTLPYVEMMGTPNQRSVGLWRHCMENSCPGESPITTGDFSWVRNKLVLSHWDFRVGC